MGAVDSPSLGVGTGRETLSQKLRLNRRVRGSSFGNGLEVGVLLPAYRASHQLTELIERTSFPSDHESRHTFIKRQEAPKGLPLHRHYVGTQTKSYVTVRSSRSPKIGSCSMYGSQTMMEPVESSWLMSSTSSGTTIVLAS